MLSPRTVVGRFAHQLYKAVIKVFFACAPGLGAKNTLLVSKANAAVRPENGLTRAYALLFLSLFWRVCAAHCGCVPLTHGLKPGTCVCYVLYIKARLSPGCFLFQYIKQGSVAPSGTLTSSHLVRARKHPPHKPIAPGCIELCGYAGVEKTPLPSFFTEPLS